MCLQDGASDSSISLRTICIGGVKMALVLIKVISAFPGSSAGKEFVCYVGDPSSIPRLESNPGEGIGYPLQYSWASLVAQMVKNLPAMRGTWAQSLG